VSSTSSSRRLAPADWVDAALTAVVEGGVSAVSVEGLARTLGATKGSFYWHFANREALVDAALAAWEAGETLEVERVLAPLADAEHRLRHLLHAALDDRRGARIEAALLADAGVPQVAAALERATRTRTAYVRHLFRELGVDSPAERATTVFALYLGLLHLRRAAPSSAPTGDALEAYVEHLCDWLTGTRDREA
jgi:AcrR family transcriptional regulator